MSKKYGRPCRYDKKLVNLIDSLSKELNITLVKASELVYLKAKDNFKNSIFVEFKNKKGGKKINICL